MAAQDYRRAGLPAPVVDFGIYKATMFWGNEKSNRSLGKMAERYTVWLKLDDDTIVEDVIDWRAAGAGRNCYFFRDHPLALKLFADDTQQWNHNQMEQEALCEWLPRLPQHLSPFFGRYVMCHDGEKHRLDAILVGKLGPTLRTILTDISDDVEDPIMEYVNERTMKRQARKHFLEVVCACERAFHAGLMFYANLHMDKICLDEVTQQWIFIDLEIFQKVPPHFTFRLALQTAAKFLLRGFLH
ncbi:unnamed protein product [Symbiodinium natans]|uniref:Protein kinase domain-containing protein n=1 Tax=Symbiodinium natans TaxID=878477 RepID=A0A812JFL9_9DINO|nr:unnamed protein product [Symbiodinium natans]